MQTLVLTFAVIVFTVATVGVRGEQAFDFKETFTHTSPYQGPWRLGYYRVDTDSDGIAHHSGFHDLFHSFDESGTVKGLQKAAGTPPSIALVTTGQSYYNVPLGSFAFHPPCLPDHANAVVARFEVPHEPGVTSIASVIDIEFGVGPGHSVGDMQAYLFHSSFMKIHRPSSNTEREVITHRVIAHDKDTIDFVVARSASDECVGGNTEVFQLKLTKRALDDCPVHGGTSCPPVGPPPVPPGAPCGDGASRCIAGHCLGGHCCHPEKVPGCQRCDGTGSCVQCDFGYYLHDGTCHQKLYNGKKCNGHPEWCKSGKCLSGVCCDLNVDPHCSMCKELDGRCGGCAAGFSLTAWGKCERLGTDL